MVLRNDVEIQEGLLGLDTQDLFFQCAQKFPDSDYEENLPVKSLKKTPPKQLKRKLKKTTKNNYSSIQRKSSFVLNREPCKGRRLIQIKIIDISDENCENESDVVVSAQYVVKDFVDNILDQTERVIKNISETIIDN